MQTQRSVKTAGQRGQMYCLRCGATSASPTSDYCEHCTRIIKHIKKSPYVVTHDPTGTRIYLGTYWTTTDMKLALKMGHWPEGIRFGKREKGVVVREVVVVGKEEEEQRLERV